MHEIMLPRVASENSAKEARNTLQTSYQGIDNVKKFKLAFVEAVSTVSLVECNIDHESSCDTWYLDSGCSNHMKGNLELFSSLDKSIQTKVTLGTDIQDTMLGKGSIDILIRKGEQRVMNDVYYVSGLKHNLMSIGQLLHKEYRIYKEDNHYVILDKKASNFLIVKIKMTRNRMFPLKLKPVLKGKETQENFEVKTARSVTGLKGEATIHYS